MEAAPFDPLPRFGRRIVLRRLVHADLPAFQTYRSDEDVGRYQDWSPQTDLQAFLFIEGMSKVVLFPSGSWVQLAVADPVTNGLIGDIGICVAANGASAELGFTISQSFQRQGFGSEALREAVDLLFEHSSAVQAVCVTDARNAPSIHLLEGAKMRKTATAEAICRGGLCIEHTYAVFKYDRP